VADSLVTHVKISTSLYAKLLFFVMIMFIYYRIVDLAIHIFNKCTSAKVVEGYS
jgi:hypothetical protein